MAIQYFGGTHLIIGAGAHVPYGMPTSSGITLLLKKMYKLWYTGSTIKREQFFEHGLRRKILHLIKELKIVKDPSFSYSDTDIENLYFGFLFSFCESGVHSIDSYLAGLKKEGDQETKELFAELGKLTISVIISEYENLSPFGSHDDDWMEYIINKFIRPNVEAFFNDPPLITTFNYDRFLERRLYGHLTEYHRMERSTALEYIQKLKILHVYGDIGPVTEWLPKDEISFFSKSIKSIRVVGEERSSDYLADIKEKMSQRIANSESIYFLGYGFDSLNNKIVLHQQGLQWFAHKKVYASNVGIKGRAARDIRTEFFEAPLFQTSEGKLMEVDCLTLLKELSSFGIKEQKFPRGGNW